MAPRKGDWMQTYTGRRFWPLDPFVEDVDLHDIAHALSHICRFGGHVTRFYSVAEHSLLVARNVPAKFKAWAILHDAAEAYLSDVVRPLKRTEEFSAYREAERHLQRVILARFDLCDWLPPAVRVADDRALMTERRDLMSACDLQWSPDLEAVETFPEILPGYVPADIEEQFLSFAQALGIE